MRDQVAEILADVRRRGDEAVRDYTERFDKAELGPDELRVDSRELGYYTGAVFEVYDPAVGFALGGGGRYDDLLGRFGRELPACGIGLDVQRIHMAQAAEEALR